MLDALPDVDLDAGVKLDRADVRGTFVLEGVAFAYQMRPKVRKKSGQLQPLMAVFLLECMGQLASSGPT
jgi:hypothetical protein